MNNTNETSNIRYVEKESGNLFNLKEIESEFKVLKYETKEFESYEFEDFLKEFYKGDEEFNKTFIEEIKFGIVYKIVSNLGEEFDNDDNFCGNKTSVKISVEENFKLKEIKNIILSINERSADYGDGVSSGEILAVYNMTTKESMPIDADYYSDVDRMGDEE